jgi:hypothetical protein
LFACGGITSPALLVVAPAAPSNEPSDDHPPGDGDLFHDVGLGGAIDAPGDHDWFYMDLQIDFALQVAVRVTGGPCAGGQLHMTLLNPEQRPVRWTSVRGDRYAELRFPSLTPGRYFVELDAGDRQECVGTAYSIGRLPTFETGSRIFYDIDHSGCARARRQVVIDRRMVEFARAGATRFSGPAQHRYRGYELGWATKLAHDRAQTARKCARRR